MIVEAVAQYVRSGDGASDEWMDTMLDIEQDKGTILPGHRVFGEWSGGFLPVVLFTFRFGVMGDEISHESGQLLAESIAAEIVGETDVQVLGLKVVEDTVNAADSSRNRRGR